MLLSGASHAATLLVFGDSLSAGYGLKPGEAWPHLLQKRLSDGGYRYQVINASISGETTSGGLARLPAALTQHKPAIVVLQLGANDGLRGLPLAVMRDNLNTMIKTSQAVGAKVVVVGMRLPPNYGPDYTEKFHATFGTVAQNRNCKWVPFLMEGIADKPELFLPDGLHPTAAAQPLVLDNIWSTLRSVLGKPGRS